jgi:hypothetical protein
MRVRANQISLLGGRCGRCAARYTSQRRQIPKIVSSGKIDHSFRSARDYMKRGTSMLFVVLCFSACVATRKDWIISRADETRHG